MKRKTIAVISVAALAATAVALPTAVAAHPDPSDHEASGCSPTVYEKDYPYGGKKGGNPCGAKKGCNPCGGKTGCNPCGGKKGCNPCGGKK